MDIKALQQCQTHIMAGTSGLAFKIALTLSFHLTSEDFYANAL